MFDVLVNKLYIRALVRIILFATCQNGNEFLFFHFVPNMERFGKFFAANHHPTHQIKISFKIIAVYKRIGFNFSPLIQVWSKTIFYFLYINLSVLLVSAAHYLKYDIFLCVQFAQNMQLRSIFFTFIPNQNYPIYYWSSPTEIITWTNAIVPSSVDVTLLVIGKQMTKLTHTDKRYNGVEKSKKWRTALSPPPILFCDFSICPSPFSVLLAYTFYSVSQEVKWLWVPDVIRPKDCSKERSKTYKSIARRKGEGSCVPWSPRWQIL